MIKQLFSLLLLFVAFGTSFEIINRTKAEIYVSDGYALESDIYSGEIEQVIGGLNITEVEAVDYTPFNATIVEQARQAMLEIMAGGMNSPPEDEIMTTLTTSVGYESSSVECSEC